MRRKLSSTEEGANAENEATARELEKRKKDLEGVGKMLQVMKAEKDKVLGELSNENTQITKELERLTRDNLEKDESIHELELDLRNQEAELANMQVQIEKLKKKK